LGIGLLSLLISASALYVSFVNTRSNQSRENKQFELLGAIDRDLNAQGEAIIKELKTQERSPAQDSNVKTQSNKRLEPAARGK